MVTCKEEYYGWRYERTNFGNSAGIVCAERLPWDIYESIINAKNFTIETKEARR